MVATAPPVTSERLLSPVARRWALAIGGLAAVLALGLAVAYAGDRKLGSFDEHIMVRIYAYYPDRRAIAHRVSDIGGAAAAFLIVLALVIWLYVHKRPRGIALAVLGPTVSVLVTEYVLKPSVDRRLLGYVTYPSGHTTSVFSVATVIAVLLVGDGARSQLVARVAGVVVVYAVGLLVAVSLVAAGYHVPTDTVGGAGVAIATVLLLSVAIDAVADRRITRR